MQSVTSFDKIKQKIQTEISHQQNVAAQKYKGNCFTILNTLSHHAIKIFVSWALNVKFKEHFPPVCL